MSFDLCFGISKDVFSEERYRRFIAECSTIKGNWQLSEAFVIEGGLSRDYPIDDFENYRLHKFNLSGFKDGDEINGEKVNVWIDLNTSIAAPESLDCRRYSRVVDIETSSGRSLLGLAIQFLIPLKGFQIFQDIVVFDEMTEKLYSTIEDYRRFAKEKLFETFQNGDIAYYLYLFPLFDI